MAFSGGVDGTFSAWRHTQSKCSYRSQEINLCAMVHGFDIALDNEHAFNNARRNAQKILNDIGLDLYSIKTNYRLISKVDWRHVFACALVSALSNFKQHASTCLIGSGETYNSLVIPWGSSPITDHLLSSGDFDVMHDGASHSRTEKVKEISKWKAGTENLRVCWEGEAKDRNCSVCEKCVRTKLNFLASGAPIPSCFPDSDIINNLKDIRLRNDVMRMEWKQLYEYAIKNKLEYSWVKILPAIINRGAEAKIVASKPSRPKKIINKIIRKIRQY